MDKAKLGPEWSLPEHLKGKKAHEEMKHEGHGHEEGNKRWAAEEWEGAPADRRDADTGVPGVESPRGKPAETVEGREGWRD